MDTYAQAERLVQVETPLGKDAFVLEAFAGREELSRLFQYRLDLLAARDDIAADEIVGKNVSFLVRQADGESRYFNGFVQRFAGGDTEAGRLRRYTMDVVPWLWFLTRTSDCRIFQEKSAPDIIEQIFGDLGFSDYRLDLGGTHPVREYCVQYRETDFAFVSRLAEEEGIFYFFEHEQGKHTLVLSDQKTTHKFCPERDVKFSQGALDEDHLTYWEHRYEFRTGKWAQTDYNFKTPSTSLMTTTSTLVKLPKVDKYEHYEYPGLYGAKGDGDGLTKLRMEMDESGYDTVSGAGSCRSFTTGGKFTLKEHTAKAETGKTYIITALEHRASSPAQITGGGGELSYDNAFTCIPDSATFRPPLTTPKPTIQGLQTAVVTGPAGEEIYPDEYGRVKVQFHWDREGQKDEKTSIWVRVSQHVAGRGWGFHGLPRIGQEVVIAFLDGDPDRPLIVGSVYNDENMPPYEYPANKTRTGVKSRSTKSGSAENFNEIRFEDKKGEEEVYIHAEKDQNNVVENDETTSVGHDRTEDVGNDETITIGNNRTEKVEKNETISIGESRTESVGKDETISIKDNRTEDVGKDESITIGQKRIESVGKDETVDVGENRTHSVGKDDILQVGKKLTVQAGDQIMFKTGGASITMKKDGTILIQGKDITVKGSGKVNIKASSNVIVKGSKILQN